MEANGPRRQNCANCPSKGKTCGNRGPEDALFVMVGESPGHNELRANKPFVGESGLMMKTVIEEICGEEGVPVPEIFYTNAFMCTVKGKKDKKGVERCAQACHTRLMEDIGVYQRKVILALGNGAVQSLTGDYSIKITQDRGRTYKSELASKGIVGSVHPAFLLRGGGSFNKFKDDIRSAILIYYDKPLHRYVHSKEVVCNTEEEIHAAIDLMLLWARNPLKVRHVAMDIETSDFFGLDGELLAIQFCWEFSTSYIIPDHLCRSKAAIRLLRLPQSHIKYVWHNGKFDKGFIETNFTKPTVNPTEGIFNPPTGGVETCSFSGMGGGIPVDEDTMLLSYALDENRGLHDLEQASYDACRAPNWKSMIDEHRPTSTASYSHIPRHILYKYGGKDTSATLQTFYVLRPRVARDPHLEKLYTQTLMGQVNILCEAEKEGLLPDLVQIEKNALRLRGDIDDSPNTKTKELPEGEIGVLRRELQAISEKRIQKSINPNSPQQVAELLYDGLKLPKIRGSRSTDADTLDMLPKNKVVEILKKYRRVAKLNSTYVKGLRRQIRSDGKIHPTFLIHGTVTGRLASSKPNVQNIPREPDFRSQFMAPPGYIFLEPDLNQAELRSLAQLSQDPVLLEIYNSEDESLHEVTRAALYGLPSEWVEAEWLKYLNQFLCSRDKVVGEQKMRAKAVNFGIVYGRTAPSLADEFHTTVDEGQRMIDAWFRKYVKAKEFIDQCRSAPTRGKVLITPFGRNRRFGVVSKESLISIQNEASNFPHQSIASDINTTAVRRAYEVLRPSGARLCNLVHDSSLWIIRDDYDTIMHAYEVIKWHLENEAPRWGLNDVPFLAEAKIGYRWGHMRDSDNDNNPFVPWGTIPETLKPIQLQQQGQEQAA